MKKRTKYTNIMRQAQFISINAATDIRRDGNLSIYYDEKIYLYAHRTQSFINIYVLHSDGKTLLQKDADNINTERLTGTLVFSCTINDKPTDYRPGFWEQHLKSLYAQSVEAEKAQRIKSKSDDGIRTAKQFMPFDDKEVFVTLRRNE